MKKKNYILIMEAIKVTYFGKTLLFVYSLLVAGMVFSISCVKQKETQNPLEYKPSAAVFELEDEDLDDLPEDTGE